MAYIRLAYQDGKETQQNLTDWIKPDEFMAYIDPKMAAGWDLSGETPKPKAGVNRIVEAELIDRDGNVAYSMTEAEWLESLLEE